MDVEVPVLKPELLINEHHLYFKYIALGKSRTKPFSMAEAVLLHVLLGGAYRTEDVPKKVSGDS